jgi:hypothetical protein
VKQSSFFDIESIDDGIFNQEAKVVGLSMSRVYVDGSVADNRAFSRSSVKDSGFEDGVLTVELAEIEKDNLRVDFQSLFSITGAKVTVEDEDNSADHTEQETAEDVIELQGARS